MINTLFHLFLPLNYIVFSLASTGI